MEIGTQYHAVGTALLNDESGVIIPAIVSEHNGNVEFINMDILRRWVQGQGVTCSWRRLIQVLGLPCPKLATDIEESLRAEESTNVSIIHMYRYNSKSHYSAESPALNYSYIYR